MNIIDKYVSKKFWLFFSYASAAFLCVFVIVDLVENLDRYLDKGARAVDVAYYYVFYLPYIYILTIPVATLLATVFLGGYLVKNHELVALRSAGIPTKRVGTTLLFWSILISIATFGIGEFLMPPSNMKRQEIKQTRINRKTTNNTDRTITNLFYIGEDGGFYFFQTFSLNMRAGQNITIQYMDNGKITRRIDAQTMKWTGEKWRLLNVYDRTFGNDTEKMEFFPETLITIDERPENFARKMPRPDEMGVMELQKYIAKLRRTGMSPKRETTDLWMKFAFPLANIIVVMLGVSLAFKQRKGGYMLGFGQSFFVAFFYLTTIRAGQAFGYNGALSPIIAAFAGDVLFFAVAGTLWFKNRD